MMKMFSKIWPFLVGVALLLFWIGEIITRYPQLSQYRWILLLPAIILVTFVVSCGIMNILDKKISFNDKMKSVAGLFFILGWMIYLFKDVFKDILILMITSIIFFVLSGFTFLGWKIMSIKNRGWSSSKISKGRRGSGRKGAHFEL